MVQEKNNFYTYKEFAEYKCGLSDNEVLLFTTQGIYKIDVKDFDAFTQDKVVSYGEEGKVFNYNLAITTLNSIVGDININRYFTEGAY